MGFWKLPFAQPDRRWSYTIGCLLHLYGITLNQLTSTESIIIGFVVGILCPLLLFVLFWWVAASLYLFNAVQIPESGVAVTAIAGLVLGITLDLLYIKRWISQFYSVDLRVLVLVYLICSMMAVAFFMGLPAGNLVLGTLAGVYIGRREVHGSRSSDLAMNTIRKASFFTTIVTGGEALVIGLLALNEDWVVEWLVAVTGISPFAVTSWFGTGLILALCAVLMVVQFWCTRTMAWITFERGREKVI
jgi:hypothetical protein